MEQKTITIISIAVFICFLVFAVVMMLLINENNKCVGNPFVYSANTIETKENYLMCSCEIGTSTFYFDKEGLYKENPLLGNLTISERGLTP